MCLSARILSWQPAFSLVKEVLIRISKAFRHSRTRLTFSLVDSGKTENYMVHWHSMSVYCVPSLERRKSHTLWNTHLFQPCSQDQAPFTILWPSGPSTCVGQVPLWQIHDTARLSNLLTWHLSYTASISHHPTYPKNFQKSGPRSYTSFCHLIILYTPLRTKRYTVNILIIGWKFSLENCRDTSDTSLDENLDF